MVSRCIRWVAAWSLALTSLWAQADGLWEQRAALPIEATEVSAAAIGQNVYVTCGILPGLARSNRLFIYNTVEDEWREGAPLPVPAGADHCNLAAVGGKLYFLGGTRFGAGAPIGETFEYDPGMNRWEPVGQMPTPRGAAGVAAIGQTIYVAGGEGSAGAGSAFEAFDTVARRWDQLSDLPLARTHLTAQAVDGRFYAIGGRIGGIGTVLGANQMYDPEARTWTTRAAMPTPRGGLGSGAIAGRIQVFGGEGPSGTPELTFWQNEEYDPETNTWRTLAAMPTPRHGLYGATLEGGLFASGGGPRAGASFSSAHEVFYLPPAPPPAIEPGGVVSAASFQQSVAPGSLVALFGTGLSLGSRRATRLPLASRLNAVSVTVNGEPAPLFFVSPSQINLQLPWNVSGALAVAVSNVGVESGLLQIASAELAPAIFTLNQSGSGPGAILIAGAALLATPTPGVPSRAVHGREAVEIFCAGLGEVSPAVPAGEPAPVAPLARTLARPRVRIGGVESELLFSGLAPGLVGVYQVNARVPLGVSGSDLPLEMAVADAVSNAVTLAVEQPGN